MAPEQIRGQPVDHRVDLFAAGVVFWQLLTGRPLYEGQGSPAVWSKIIRWQPPPPSHVNPAVPPALDAAVLHALERNPDRRFQTAAAFAEATERSTTVAKSEAIASWAKDVAGELLERRARRAREILDGPTRRSLGRRASPRPRLIRRMSAAWRIGSLALLLVAMTGTLISVSRPGGTRPAPPTVIREDPPAAAAVERLMAAPPRQQRIALIERIGPPPGAAEPQPGGAG